MFYKEGVNRSSRGDSMDIVNPTPFGLSLVNSEDEDEYNMSEL